MWIALFGFVYLFFIVGYAFSQGVWFGLMLSFGPLLIGGVAFLFSGDLKKHRAMKRNKPAAEARRRRRDHEAIYGKNVKI